MLELYNLSEEKSREPFLEIHTGEDFLNRTPQETSSTADKWYFKRFYTAKGTIN